LLSEKLTQLIRVALGTERADLAIVNGLLVNVYTGELLSGYSVAVKGERIAYVGKDIHQAIGPETVVIDATGKTIAPGFIDGHTHMCYMCSIDQFLRYAMRGGTTTFITELMEPAFPLGYLGILEFLKSFKDQPVKIFSVAPPMITFSPGARARAINIEQIRELLQREDILGLGETYWFAVVAQDKKILEFFAETGKARKKITGHSAGAKGNKLAAYVASGVSSCHEPITVEEVIERLRMGMYVLVREGWFRKELAAIAPVKDLPLDLHQLILATDSMSPQQIVKEGYLEVVLQKAIDLGFDPVSAIQMVTINVARYFNLDERLGGIAPGKYADIVILPNIQNIRAEYVISNGRVIARDGELLVPSRKHSFPEWVRQSIRLKKKFIPDDFLIHVSDVDSVKVRIIEQVTELVTREIHLDVPVFQGTVKIDLERDLLKVAAIDFVRPEKQFVGLIKGFKIKRGALASSLAWDLTNIITVGAREEDMALAVNRIVELQGGAVVCADGQVLAELSLPLGGYLTDSPIEELVQKTDDFQRAAAGLGAPFSDVHLTLATLTTPAIPHFRIYEEGLVNLREQRRVGLLVP